MNGLAITIFVGQLPKLCGFSTDADGFVDELRTFVDGFDGRNSTALAARPGHAGRPARAAPPHPRRAGGAGRRGRGHGGDRGVRSGHPHRRGARPGAAPPGAAVDRARRCRADARRRGRDHAGLADRHDRHVDQLRRPPRRRGRSEPGDDRHRDGERGGRVLPGLRRVDQRLAHGGGRAVRRQEPAHRSRRRVPRRPAAAVLQRAARRPPADGAGRRRHRRRAVAGRSRLRPPLRPGPHGRRCCSRWSPPPASCSSASWKGS